MGLFWGMFNGEIDGRISERLQNVHPGKVNCSVNDLHWVQHAVALGPCEQALSRSSDCTLPTFDLFWLNRFMFSWKMQICA